MNLRPYQVQAIEGIRDHLRRGTRRVLLVSPTGSGKTVTAAEIIHSAVRRGTKSVFLAHRRELIAQCSRKLDLFGVDHGIMQGSHPRFRPWEPVQVASVQTLARREQKPEAQLIIVDEAHHARAATYEKIFASYPGVPIVGLTATPWRTDGKGLGDLFEAVVVATTPAALVEEGHLVPCTGYAFAAPDLSKVKTVAGDYDEGELGEVMSQTAIVGGIVEQWLAHAGNVRTVVFAVHVAHSKQIVEQFRARGVAAEHVDGTMEEEERDAILARLASGETRVVSNCQILTEGWDCLDSETEILTDSGWRGMGEVQKGSRVYSLNRETGRLELAQVDDYGERPVRPGERMFAIESQHANIRTTEGHEFHVKYRDPGLKGALSARFITRTGTQLAARRSAYALPLAAECAEPFPGVPISDDELRFVAWFMTDGGFVGSNVAISQSKDYHHEIRALLRRIGLDFKERRRKVVSGFPTDRPVYEFRIPKGVHTGSLKRKGWSNYAAYLDKNVASPLHQMTRSQFLTFWEELLKGDGQKQGNKAGWLWCDRKEQADAYTQMAILRGLSASYTEVVTTAGTTVYRVSVRETQWLTSDPADHRAARVRLEDPKPGEIVWCVRNRNSTLVTRRRGKIAIIGNCPQLGCVIMARPTKSLGLYLQCVGRGLRPACMDCGEAASPLLVACERCGSPNIKRVARLHDHAGCSLEHGLPTDERDYSLTASPPKTRGGKGHQQAAAVRICQKCFLTYKPTLDTCPGCGHRNPVKVTQVVEVEGEAIPLEQIKTYVRTDERSKRNYYFAQLRLAQQKGHKLGAAYHRFRAKFGEAPPREWLAEFQRKTSEAA